MIVQLWIVASQTLTEEMVQLSEPIRLWNVLSYFTIWSNILVTVVAYLLARDPATRPCTTRCRSWPWPATCSSAPGRGSA